jgi:MFS family permease
MLWASMQLVPTLGAIAIFRLTSMESLSGLGLTVTLLLSASGAFVGGRLMDRFGRRPILALGGLLVVAGGSIIVWAIISASLGLFVAGLAVFGSGFGIGQLVRFAAADMYPPASRGLGVSLVLLGGTVGAIGGPLLIGPLSSTAENLGFGALAAPWIIAPLAMAIAVVAVLLVRPDPRDIASNLSHYYGGLKLPIISERPRSLGTLLGMFPTRASLVTVVLVQSNMSLLMGIMSFVLNSRGWGIANVSAMMSVHFLGMFGLSIVAGRLTDRFGRRQVLILAAIISGFGSILVPLSDNFLPIGLGFFMIGLGWNLGFIAGTTTMSDVTRPLERGKLLGFNDLIMSLSAASASLLGGILLGTLGLLAVGLFGLAISLAPLAFTLRLREPRPGIYSSAEEPAGAGCQSEASAGVTGE